MPIGFPRHENPVRTPRNPAPPKTSISMFWAIGKRQPRGRHASKSATIAIPRDAPAALDSAPRFEVEANCLSPVTDIEFAKQIAQMKFNRIDRHAEFPRQLSIALTRFQCGK